MILNSKLDTKKITIDCNICSWCKKILKLLGKHYGNWKCVKSTTTLQCS